MSEPLAADAERRYRSGRLKTGSARHRAIRVSTPVENSPLRWDGGLQLQPVGVKMRPAGEAEEAGSGGDRPDEE